MVRDQKRISGPLQLSLWGRDALRAAKGKVSTKELHFNVTTAKSGEVLFDSRTIDLPTLFVENKVWEGLR
jgi:hypothetical protein